MSFAGDITKAIRTLRAINHAADNALPVATQSGAEVVRDDAKRRAPRRSGKLASSIEIKDGSKSPGFSESIVRVGEFYGLFHEFGTSKMAAHPFLRPAGDASEAEVGRIIENSVFSAINREATK